MLWEIDLHPREGAVDREATAVADEIVELGIAERLQIRSARGYLIESPSLEQPEAEQLANELFAETTIEQSVCAKVGDTALASPPGMNGSAGSLIQVLLKPGVMDPVAQSAEPAARDLWALDRCHSHAAEVLDRWC